MKQRTVDLRGIKNQSTLEIIRRLKLSRSFIYYLTKKKFPDAIIISNKKVDEAIHDWYYKMMENRRRLLSPTGYAHIHQEHKDFIHKM